MVITQWQLCICVCKSPSWCHPNLCVKVPDQTCGQPQHEPLLTALYYQCRPGRADLLLLCAHWAPWTDACAHWPSAYTGQQEGSGHQDREPLNLPAPWMTTNCLLLSHICFFHRVIPSLCPFFFALSAFLFSPSSRSLSSLVPSDPELICLFKFLPVLRVRRRCPFPSPFPLFPTAAFRKLSCVKWDRADWLPVLVRARETVKRL